MRFYPAIIDRGSPRVFGVTFPDLPGCTSCSGTLEEALNKAPEALALHLEGMVEDGEKIPHPSRLENLTVPRDLDIVMVTLIPAAD